MCMFFIRQLFRPRTVRTRNCSSTVNVEQNSPTGPAVVVPQSKLLFFLKFVDYERLSYTEKVIHDTHVHAIMHNQETYKDPATGYDVLTRLAHLRRGECCGNACRHCPYSHRAVEPGLAVKKFNSAFYS